MDRIDQHWSVKWVHGDRDPAAAHIDPRRAVPLVNAEVAGSPDMVCANHPHVAISANAYVVCFAGHRCPAIPIPMVNIMNGVDDPWIATRSDGDMHRPTAHVD